MKAPTTNGASDRMTRNVYRSPAAAAGWRVYYAIDSRGEVVASAEVLERPDISHQHVREFLHGVLDVIDPVPVAPACPAFTVVVGAAQPRASRRRPPRLTLTRGGAS